MYRTIDCATWDDPWFAELSPNAKLLFLYFITNRRTSAAGCFEITRRAMMFESGIRGEALDATLDELSSRVVWWPELQVIFVRNFYKHQAANSNKQNFLKSALKSLADLPEIVQETVGDAYPELRTERLSHAEPIPNPSHTHGDKETETETETETGESARKTTRATATPNAYQPSETQYAWALAELGFDTVRVDRETEKFLDHHRAHGSTMKNWDAAWRNWMRRTVEFAPRGKGGAPTQSVDGKPYWDGTQYRRADGLVV